MIYGIGTDIVSLRRIERLYKKYGRVFAERILHTAELAEFSAAAQPARFLAKRFAAKEAFAKAVGTGIRGEVSFHNIGIAHDAAGRPEFYCRPALAARLAERGTGRVHLSLSDEEDYICAFAVAECLPAGPTERQP